MSNYSSSFLSDKDIKIDHIEKNLKIISKAIKDNNKKNLMDINVVCEEIFGRVLNELFSLNLKAMSAVGLGTFVAVDLIDYTNRVAYQVTSRTDWEKIKSTVEKYNKSKDLEKVIDHVYILILGDDAHTYREKSIDLNNGNKFSVQDDVRNFTWLIEQIKKKSLTDPSCLSRMYDAIRMVFDSGRLIYESVVDKNDLFTFSHTVESDIIGWEKGTGDIRLRAYIPRKYGQKICCSIEFRKNNICGNTIVVGPEKLINEYFVDEQLFLNKHCSPRYGTEEEMYIQLEGVQMKMNARTIKHLYDLLSDLSREYTFYQKRIEDKLGTAGMMQVDEYYKLMTLTEKEYKSFIAFGREHDYYADDGNERFNVFNTITSNIIQLSPFHRTSTAASILAKLHFKKRDTYYDILWEPGWECGKDIMDGIDNVDKWKADYTRDWINEVLSSINAESVDVYSKPTGLLKLIKPLMIIKK